MVKPTLRVGLIGSGFIGKAHVFGYATAERAFDLPYAIVFDTIADLTDEMANLAAA